ncbi:hypothetical protein WKI68_05135 [Streptomyces sp. MS1.HAVA.3]|uniref:RCK N-terminal domain-containing protein n=1 Tax=Streptomyces caledonius TaxID=3134107 RepID=A0ABU8TZF4_9ACTN
MAPRGIVAASTAAAFAASLVQLGLRGASKILPITFLVIVSTVVLYALTAGPVARRLGVARPDLTRPLLVGGAPWVIALGRALRSAGIDVQMWAGLAEERERIKDAGIKLARGDLLATATNPRARLEGVNAVFLLTDDDDFNALASVLVEDNVEGPVFRVDRPTRATASSRPTRAAPSSSAAHSSGTSWRHGTSRAPGSWRSPPPIRSRRDTKRCSWSAPTADWTRSTRGSRSPRARATSSSCSARCRRPSPPWRSAAGT